MVGKRNKEIKPGAYEDAILGFRNHWYPGLPGTDIGENEIKALVLLGENILLKRIDGEVFAVRDACVHRGYKFSEKPECFTKNTITCPVHAFTYNLRNGELVTIPSDPESPLIGKANLHSYPVREVNGIIFIFVGDMMEVPPLEDDVPPGFLNEDLFVVPAVCVECDSNWRIAADSGFDPNHIFMHKDNGMIKHLQIPFPFATRLRGDDPYAEIELIEGPGPKGLTDRLGETDPVFDFTFECDGETGHITSMFPPDGADGMAMKGFGSIVGSLWLPGVLNVDPWPVPGMTHYEWWVPIDETHHRYFIAWGKRTTDPVEQDAFKEEVKSLWIEQGYENFNRIDVLMNNGMQESYAEPGYAYGQKETLAKTDGYTISWRRLATKYNRGIQTRYGSG